MQVAKEIARIKLYPAGLCSSSFRSHTRCGPPYAAASCILWWSTGSGAAQVGEAATAPDDPCSVQECLSLVGDECTRSAPQRKEHWRWVSRPSRAAAWAGQAAAACPFAYIAEYLCLSSPVLCDVATLFTAGSPGVQAGCHPSGRGVARAATHPTSVGPTV